jgi:TatA/E family protein of Tat protein translocase
MFGIGVPEVLVILVVALVLFGPGKLPEIGGALGKGIRDFRRSLSGADDSPESDSDRKHVDQKSESNAS